MIHLPPLPDAARTPEHTFAQCSLGAILVYPCRSTALARHCKVTICDNLPNRLRPAGVVVHLRPHLREPTSAGALPRATLRPLKLSTHSQRLLRDLRTAARLTKQLALRPRSCGAV